MPSLGPETIKYATVCPTCVSFGWIRSRRLGEESITNEQKSNEYDQILPQSHTADQITASRGRAMSPIGKLCNI